MDAYSLEVVRLGFGPSAMLSTRYLLVAATNAAKPCTLQLTLDPITSQRQNNEVSDRWQATAARNENQGGLA